VPAVHIINIINSSITGIRIAIMRFVIEDGNFNRIASQEQEP
jgi:hypothetical protein